MYSVTIIKIESNKKVVIFKQIFCVHTEKWTSKGNQKNSEKELY